jgi:hypothetical protein
MLDPIYYAAIRPSDRLFKAIAKMRGLSGVAVCIGFLRHSAKNIFVEM